MFGVHDLYLFSCQSLSITDAFFLVNYSVPQMHQQREIGKLITLKVLCGLN